MGRFLLSLILMGPPVPEEFPRSPKVLSLNLALSGWKKLPSSFLLKDSVPLIRWIRSIIEEP